MCLFPVVATWWYFVFVPVFPLTNPKKNKKKHSRFLFATAFLSFFLFNSLSLSLFFFLVVLTKIKTCHQPTSLAFRALHGTDRPHGSRTLGLMNWLTDWLMNWLIDWTNETCRLSLSCRFPCQRWMLMIFFSRPTTVKARRTHPAPWRPVPVPAPWSATKAAPTSATATATSTR